MARKTAKPKSSPVKSLKVGDLIRIVALPGGLARRGGCIHRDTVRAYKALMARRRPVRIVEWDHGHPWFSFQLRGKSGRIEFHWMVVMDGDDNWVAVKRRPRPSR
jgi:hypothetical protein